MKVEVKINSDCIEPKIIIETNQMNEDIEHIIEQLSRTDTDIIKGFYDDIVEILDENSIFRIYASNGKVYAATKDKNYTLRLRLYEVQKRLNSKRFVRISNSEIINLNKVRKFDLSFAGTICVIFVDGTTSYVSRRYVKEIKNILGI